MRRAVLTMLLGGVLLTGTACGNDAASTTAAPSGQPAGSAGQSAQPAPSTNPSGQPAASAGQPAASANPSGQEPTAETPAVCAKVEKVLAKRPKAFGEDLGRLIANRQAKDANGVRQATATAQKRLRAFAAEIGDIGATAKDPEMRQAAATTAASIRATAKDDAYFAQIRNTKDLDDILQQTMIRWLTPIAGTCA